MRINLPLNVNVHDLNVNWIYINKYTKICFILQQQQQYYYYT